jgi:guanine deaminase
MGVAADTDSDSNSEPAAASQELFMRTALEMARRGMAAGGPPVGACLVRDGRLVSRNHNAVVSELDITAHAEIVIIREACRELRSLNLEGCVLYVTVEPCPMCLAACHYAGIRTIYYGSPISAMHAITGSELLTSADALFANSGDRPLIRGGVLADECQVLLDQWAAGNGARN